MRVLQAQGTPPTSAAAEFRRGWPIILVAAIGLGCGLSAVPIYSLGALTKPLASAMGWTRAETQGIYTWMTIGNLLAAPALGWFLDHRGLRRITLWSLVGMAVGLASLGWITGPLWSFYLVAFLTAVLGVGTVPITWTRSVVDWFEIARGRALGIALAGTGVAAIFIPSYASWLIQSVGWRWAFVGLAALPALIALPISWLWLRERPDADSHRRASAATTPLAAAAALAPTPLSATTSGSSEVGFAQALRGYRFWVMTIVFVVVGIGIAGLIADLIPMLTDRGMPTATAARVAGAIGVSVIVGRVGTGYLIDRFWAPGAAVFILALPAGACVILASGAAGVAAATVAAVLIGLAAGAEFDLMSFLVSRYFAHRRYGIIYSCLYALFKLGAGIGAPLFALSYDSFGSYVAILYISAVALIAASLLLLVLGPYTTSLPAREDAQASAPSA